MNEVFQGTLKAFANEDASQKSLEVPNFPARAS